jgi:hypothetical protein
MPARVLVVPEMPIPAGVRAPRRILGICVSAAQAQRSALMARARRPDLSRDPMREAVCVANITCAKSTGDIGYTQRAAQSVNNQGIGMRRQCAQMRCAINKIAMSTLPWRARAGRAASLGLAVEWQGGGGWVDHLSLGWS